jgi:uncharacterized membrane protein YeiB
MAARSNTLDALRGLAVMFMLEVHLGFWWARELPEGDPLVGLGTALGGMAAPLFFTVAGAGLVLSRQREPGPFQAKNIRRGAVLLAMGLVFTLVERAIYGPWGWGVLQCLGVSVIISTLAMKAGPAARAGAGIALMAAAPLFRNAAGIPDVLFSESMMAIPSISAYLSSATLSGFFPLIPWTGLMLIGTVAGELSFPAPSRNPGVAGPSGNISWPMALLAAFLVFSGTAGAAGGMPMEFFPPSLPFCLLASGLCVAAIAVASVLPGRHSNDKRVRPLASAGRLSLTFFVAHHLIGYEAFSAAGMMRSFDTPVALAMVLFAWAIALAVAVVWSTKDYRYSLEWLLGRLADRASK